MRKNVVSHITSARHLATVTALLFGATAGISRPIFADEPVLPDVNLPDVNLPDVNLPDVAVETNSNPVAQLPAAPVEPPRTTATSSPASSVITRQSTPTVSSPVVLKVATPPAIARQSTSEADVSTPEAQTQQKARPGESLRDLAKRLNLALPLSQGRIVVTKSQRQLDLYHGNVLLKSYNVALGSNPVGHKKQQGDGRTPEGQFYICTRNNKTSAFHIFLGLSYPALPDAKRAVENKAISPREFQIIRQRLASRSAPLWGTRLGGWVGIHGGTNAAFAQRTMKARKSRDWTAGCVALNNREIEELYAATQIGTPVLVKP